MPGDLQLWNETALANPFTRRLHGLWDSGTIAKSFPESRRGIRSDDKLRNGY